MRNLCMKISYDGTAYSGFQSQPLVRTIQGEIERALHTITGEKIAIISSGRTDAGVHAYGQIINFTTHSPMELRRWCLAMNSVLPRDIVALEVKEVPTDFHARRASSRKTYCYSIHNYRHIDVFQRLFRYHHPNQLDVAAMQDACTALAGEHDFTSFCSVRSTKVSHVRIIYEVRLEVEQLFYRADEGKVLHLVMTGNGFLYNMVRIIAGTLVLIGEGKLQSSDMMRILQARDRSLAGPTAPANGLSLVEVRYDD